MMHVYLHLRARHQAWLLSILVMLCMSGAATRVAADDAPGAHDTDPWHRLQQAAWVAQGPRHPTHLIYVITDPNCPFCHELWQELQPFYKQGLQVRYVMVGVISQDSPAKAAAILEARDPSRALDRDEKRWGQLPDDPGGGIAPATSPKPATLAAIGADEQLMRDLGIQGTPAFIYRDADHRLHVAQSASDPTSLQAIITASTAE